MGVSVRYFLGGLSKASQASNSVFHPWYPCMGVGLSGGNRNTLFIAGRITGGLRGDSPGSWRVGARTAGVGTGVLAALGAFAGGAPSSSPPGPPPRRGSASGSLRTSTGVFWPVNLSRFRQRRLLVGILRVERGGVP